jgi:hypothetical protein
MSNIMVYLFNIYCGVLYDVCGKTMYNCYSSIDIYGKKITDTNSAKLTNVLSILILPNQIMYEGW